MFSQCSKRNRYGAMRAETTFDRHSERRSQAKHQQAKHGSGGYEESGQAEATLHNSPANKRDDQGQTRTSTRLILQSRLCDD
jgi:hypothetical protein